MTQDVSMQKRIHEALRTYQENKKVAKKFYTLMQELSSYLEQKGKK